MAATHDVCYVNPEGELICSGSLTPRDTTPFHGLASHIQAAAPNVGPNALALIIQLAAEVATSPLTDECIGTRGPDTVGSVRQILDTNAPVMLLYRYYRLPGDILATYYISKAQYDAARAALNHWSEVKDAC
jgi:hypothetical protein